MIPNWLLGKSKSKLQEILGGGGGGGTAYTAGEGINITNHEISVDPVLLSDIGDMSDAIPLKAAKTQITNPNILHNPWFTVNQRAVTSVTESLGYIADRWKVYSTNVTFTVSRNASGNIVIDNTSGAEAITIYQKRTSTYINSLAGMKLTFSVEFSNGEIKSGSALFDGETYRYVDEDDYHLYFSKSDSAFGINIHAGASLTIKALKLEVGEVSTLAMDSRPEYAIELAKCQRYFQRLANITTGTSNYALGIGVGSGARFIISIPEMMRIDVPTLTGNGLRALDPSNGNAYVATSVDFQTLRGTQLCIGLSFTSATAGKTYLIQIDNSTIPLDLSAEL